VSLPLTCWLPFFNSLAIDDWQQREAFAKEDRTMRVPKLAEASANLPEQKKKLASIRSKLDLLKAKSAEYEKLSGIRTQG
jgi:division protein CdvB (Snf7/Vps24/ESCRT-III family)